MFQTSAQGRRADGHTITLRADAAQVRYTVEAEFVEFKGGKVHIKKEDGNVVAVSMNALSEEDQEWVKGELRRRREPALRWIG